MNVSSKSISLSRFQNEIWIFSLSRLPSLSWNGWFAGWQAAWHLQLWSAIRCPLFSFLEPVYQLIFLCVSLLRKNGEANQPMPFHTILSYELRPSRTWLSVVVDGCRCLLLPCQRRYFVAVCREFKRPFPPSFSSIFSLSLFSLDKQIGREIALLLSSSLFFISRDWR